MPASTSPLTRTRSASVTSARSRALTVTPWHSARTAPKPRAERGSSFSSHS
jgi:hypothetical protein